VIIEYKLKDTLQSLFLEVNLLNIS
jgi:hypothetical protein